MATSMTRKHFEAIAEAMKITRNASAYTESDRRVLNDAAANIASNLSQFNHAFDTARFIEACGCNE